jgi:hypothetical protein
MTSSPVSLATRKSVLLARSSLCRLQIASDVATVREGLRWPRAGIALAMSPVGRSALFGLVALVAGRGKVSRLLRAAAIALALAKVAKTAIAAKAS